jgi:hypothetical protein
VLESQFKLSFFVLSIMGNKAQEKKLAIARAVKAMKAVGETHPAALAKSPGTLMLQQSL